MSTFENNLEPGERIVYKARKRLVAYIYPLFLLGGGMMWGQLVKLASTELVLTDKRLLGKVNRTPIALPYAAIVTARTQQSLLGKLFDYGNVIIIGKDDSKIIFRGIAEPVDVKLQIDEAVEMAVLGRKLSQTVMPK